MNRTAITGSTLGVVFLSLWTRTFVAAPAGPPSVAAPPREAGSETIAAKQQEDGPWKASQDFFAGPPDACGGAASPGAQRETKWCIPPNVPVRALIAIVADPV